MINKPLNLDVHTFRHNYAKGTWKKKGFNSGVYYSAIYHRSTAPTPFSPISLLTSYEYGKPKWKSGNSAGATATGGDTKSECFIEAYKFACNRPRTK